VDIRIGGGPATEEEIAAVDSVLGLPTSGWESGQRTVADTRVAYGGHDARSRRHLLLPALHSVQDRMGWISRGALEYVSTRLSVPPAEAYGVASFYALLATEPRAPMVAHVCDDIACRLSGGEEICRELESSFGPAGESKDGRSTWLRSPCLGLCERAPAALLQRAGAPEVHKEVASAPVGAPDVEAALRGGEWPSPATPLVPQAGQKDLRLLRRVGVVDPESLDDYRRLAGYSALRRALELGPDGVIREVLDSKLVGRGGAAFPMGRKWDAVAKASVRPHYLICNADESEPGTFKDRVVMEADPFALVEAMTIAAYATGCEQGYLYIRGEYPLARRRIENALEQCRAMGLLGADIMESGFTFDIEVRRGAGAYICGEETALFNSIEGKRGEPRNKPPFPVAKGLFGKPTVVNNVETLINVLDIVLEGGAAYAGIGTEGSTGTKLFCLSGDVVKPGVYEVPFGTTLRQLLELAGGMRAGRSRAILLGGAAGSFITDEQLDVPLTFEGTRAIGSTLGSGVVLVFGPDADMGDAVLRIARFFRDESCGQCVPCRVGTMRQEELLHRMVSGRTIGSADDELALFKDLAQAMRDASICGLGQTAAAAAESALKLGLFKSNATSNGSTH
jgi:NADH-quinone oxidoreductase subunit F